MEKKRNRGTNFSKEEELLLLVEVEKLKNIIENKQSDKLHSSEKSEAWITVANNFNAINCIARSQDQLKIKYENLKMKARKFAADQRFCQGTGGGPPNINIKDPVLDAVLRIIIFKTVVGLINPFDIDSIRNNAQVIGYSTKYINESFLDLDYEISQSLLVLENWSKYTPKKLKTPISKKLKQKMFVNPIKEEYYRKKIKYLEEETKKSILQQEYIIIKRKQDKELHEKNIFLLALKTKLKQKELLK
ncbi:hypothetical protein RN001_006042 [Aquatica leii]|uniref:Regulatory protein zeste n=1 Tax=Aquatica leii TaxID=1421715 RepID=A0AAN7QKQ8_9COLE|nr:hypothetical protein RN001_006042 [Aquatica leii]